MWLSLHLVNKLFNKIRLSSFLFFSFSKVVLIHCLCDKVHLSKISFVFRFSKEGERFPVLSAGHREVGQEVFVVGSDGVVPCSVLRTGVDDTGSVERIVREKLAVA